MDVVTDVPSVLAERRALGLDRFDEVWDGVLHMVPSPSNEHQRIELRLTAALLPVCDAAGLEVRQEMNLCPPEVPDFSDFRVPDVVVYRPEFGSERGVDGAASLVVEIQSPGDASLEKLPYYDRLGVEEVVVIDRDTKAVRRWARTAGDPAGGHLTEVGPAEDGSLHLGCLPVMLLGIDGRLEVTVNGTITVI